MRHVWLAKGQVHEAIITRSVYPDGAMKGRPCLSGESTTGRRASGDTPEEVMDSLAGVFG